MRARRSNFILDAWKPSLTKIGIVATVERLDPCFIAYREAIDELKRRFPLAKFVWLPFGAHTDVFYPRKEEKSVFAFGWAVAMSRCTRPCLPIAKREAFVTSIPRAED